MRDRLAHLVIEALGDAGAREAPQGLTQVAIGFEHLPNGDVKGARHLLGPRAASEFPAEGVPPFPRWVRDGTRSHASEHGEDRDDPSPARRGVPSRAG